MNEIVKKVAEAAPTKGRHGALANPVNVETNVRLNGQPLKVPRRPG